MQKSSGDGKDQKNGENKFSREERGVNSASIRRGDVPARWFRVVSKENPEDSASKPESTSTAPNSTDGSGAKTRFDWATPFGNGGASGAYSFQTTRNLSKAQMPTVSPANRAAPDVLCELCVRRCRIAPGKTGRCSARVNVGGTLRARFYGRPVSIAIDPIEKKPLYHFLPGTPALSLGTFGCNLACQFCQNWQISRRLPFGETIQNVAEPDEIVATALARNCPSVAFTYNEPTIWAEYVVDVAKRLRRAGIKTVAVTNGMIVGRAREEFFDAVDAANVDLKAFSPDFYRDLTDGSLDAVKETLRYVAKNTNVWLEVTNLLIPTKNDSPNEIARLADWIAETLGPDVPLHFSAFFPTHRLTDVPPTPSETLVLAEKIARKSGVRNVYRGNVVDDSGQTTICPNCGTALIARSRYSTRILPTLTKRSARMKDAADGTTPNGRFQRFCGKCGTEIAGVFE